MTTTPLVYQSLVSARSRRLRVTGIVLLSAVLGMTLYGYLVLMPSLQALPHIRAHSSHSAAISAPSGSAPTKPTVQAATPDAPLVSEPERKAALAKVIFVYGYWSVCGVLLLALMLVSWLDFRELTRNYDSQRAAILAASLHDETQRGE